MPKTRRFEMTEGGHNKFWEVSPEGRGFRASWGRIEKGAQQSMLYTAEEIEKKIREKLNKGYTEV
jgi:predicted DNA-binding WGR domain protein